ncbi:MAG: hypothetical protein ACTSRK_06060 [Promethearchaeota archaeon]
MVKKILEETKISIPEVKEILDEVYIRMEKLNTPIDPFTEATFEYCHNFSKMPAKVARSVIEMLKQEYEMDDSHAIQIVNIDPNYPQEVRAIIEKDPVLKALSDEDIVVMIQKIRDLQS